MIEELEELVARLEQIAPEDHLEEPELLAAALAERAQILEAIQRADPASLPDEPRALFKARLAAVLENDQQLVTRLEELRVELRKAQNRLVTGRAAVRGYGVGASSPPPGGGRRVG